MRKIELSLPAAWLSDARPITDFLEAECLTLPLRITLKSTLRSFAGCTHWHFKHAETGRPGTLELTWWPAERRAWLTIAGSRAGAWQPALIDALRERLRAAGTPASVETGP